MTALKTIKQPLKQHSIHHI